MPTKNADAGNEKMYFAKRTHLKVPVQSPEKEKVKTENVSARVLSSRDRDRIGSVMRDDDPHRREGYAVLSTATVRERLACDPWSQHSRNTRLSRTRSKTACLKNLEIVHFFW